MKLPVLAAALATISTAALIGATPAAATGLDCFNGGSQLTCHVGYTGAQLERWYFDGVQDVAADGLGYAHVGCNPGTLVDVKVRFQDANGVILKEEDSFPCIAGNP
jgi:hypothetical protein